MYKIQSNNNEKQTNFFGVDQTKQQLINFIYKNVNLSSYKYDTLEVESELSQLILKTYYVSANFSGSNCLLIFTKIKDKFHTCLVDRKTLTFNPNKVNIQAVKTISVNLKIKNIDIYKGTILDGTFVVNKNTKTFIVTDVYTFKGEDYSKSQLESKLFTIRTFLDSNFIDDKNNNLEITVNKTYPINQTEHVVNNVVPNIKNFLIRGICFYPEISGTKLLFKFGNENINLLENNQINLQSNNQSNIQYNNQSNNQYNNQTNNQTIYKTNKKSHNVTEIKDSSSESSNNSSNTKKTTSLIVPKAPEIKKIIRTVYVPKKGKKDDEYIFEMKKTEKIDVYKLMALETVMKDNKKLLKRVQICLAYIPNIARSQWCKETMEKSSESVLVNCIFHSEKCKWEPIAISTAKKPSFVELFDIKNP